MRRELKYKGLDSRMLQTEVTEGVSLLVGGSGLRYDQKKG